ncbi:g1820 [Coccomyxa viridis]|uniref:G1820 protein n=1 Tax=Coccomyxa viridis TaxID=1274662 RepID=A0ABP1FIV3_9CHLO
MADARAAEYQRQVQELRSEIAKLEQKLAELHATDVMALNRAHQSLCQHADALELESTGVQEGLQDIRTDLVIPEHVAEELKAMGLVTGSLLVVHSLLDLTPFKGSARLLRGCWLAGGAYLAWRLSVGSIRRLSRMAGHNRKLKRELLNVWKGIEERIEIMHALSTSAPQLGQSSSIMQDSLPVPSAPPMTGGPDDGTSTYPHIWQPS